MKRIDLGNDDDLDPDKTELTPLSDIPSLSHAETQAHEASEKWADDLVRKMTTPPPMENKGSEDVLSLLKDARVISAIAAAADAAIKSRDPASVQSRDVPQPVPSVYSGSSGDPTTLGDVVAAIMQLNQTVGQGAVAERIDPNQYTSPIGPRQNQYTSPIGPRPQSIQYKSAIGPQPPMRARVSRRVRSYFQRFRRKPEPTPTVGGSGGRSVVPPQAGGAIQGGLRGAVGGAVGGVNGVVIGAVSGFTAGMISATRQVKRFEREMDSVSQGFEKYAPKTIAARADQQISQINTDIRRAEMLDTRMAEFVSLQTDVYQSFEDFKTRLFKILLEVFVPIFKAVWDLILELWKYIQEGGQKLAMALDMLAIGLRNVKVIGGMLGDTVGKIAELLHILVDKREEDGKEKFMDEFLGATIPQYFAPKPPPFQNNSGLGPVGFFP